MCRRGQEGWFHRGGKRGEEGRNRRFQVIEEKTCCRWERAAESSNREATEREWRDRCSGRAWCSLGIWGEAAKAV